MTAPIDKIATDTLTTMVASRALVETARVTGGSDVAIMIAALAGAILTIAASTPDPKARIDIAIASLQIGRGIAACARPAAPPQGDPS